MAKKKQKTIAKNLKAKPVKTVKSTSAKKKEPIKSKISAKKSAPKVKKPLAKNIVKKSAPKKAVKTKVVAKTKSVKTTKKIKETIKKPVKKITAKKSTKPESKTAKKKSDNKQSTNLAKRILAKSGEKKAEIQVENTEKKPEVYQRIVINKKSDSKNRTIFKIGDFAVYPSHGIGKIVDIEKISIRDQDFSCYLMYFEREKLTIKIPVTSTEKIGLRHLATKAQMDEVFITLRSGVKKLKGMWSRRAQEYETKINSGDIMLLAEVLRDLTRDIEDGERSYSERIIYETAIVRLASEYSAIYGSSFEEAKDKVVLTAKDKVNSEGKLIRGDDDFDDIDLKGSDSDIDDEDEEEESEDEDEEEEDDDYFDDDDDDAPKKRKRK
jgi:CarD family transcriptional regulator